MQNDMTNFAAQIAELFRQKKFDEACIEFCKNETTELSAILFLLKATAIQLAQHSAGYTLEDARNSLVAAVTLEPAYARAWIDLGHFYFAVDDNSLAALECFEKARPLCQKMHEDLVVGEVKTLLELGRKSDALSILRTIPKADASIGIRHLQDELSI